MIRIPEVTKIQELLLVLNDFRIACLISLNSPLIRANNLIENHIQIMQKILNKDSLSAQNR